MPFLTRCYPGQLHRELREHRNAEVKDARAYARARPGARELRSKIITEFRG